MRRFLISLNQGVELEFHASEDMNGGEIYVKKSSSQKIADVGRVIAPEALQELVGIILGKKLHGST